VVEIADSEAESESESEMEEEKEGEALIHCLHRMKRQSERVWSDTLSFFLQKKKKSKFFVWWLLQIVPLGGGVLHLQREAGSCYCYCYNWW
jgi:hypothetical protein